MDEKPGADASVSDHERPDDCLVQLAEAYGVATEYWDFHGKLVSVPASTIKQVLRALGVRDPEQPATALTEHEDATWLRTLPPFIVARQGESVHIPVHVTDGEPVSLTISLEDGSEPSSRFADQLDVFVEPRMVGDRCIGRATFASPPGLPLGWHVATAHVPQGSVSSPLVVVPDHLPEVSERSWGLMTQLYSVRSRRSWGIGDLADLADLASVSGEELGADFLLVNPLHAAEPVEPMTTSPYLPSTRRFVNPMYIRVEDIPEAAYADTADHSLVEWEAESVHRLNSSSESLDRDTCWAAKRNALEIIFEIPRSAARQAAYEQFRVSMGKGLSDFAVWCALVEYFDCAGQPLPAQVRDPNGDEVLQLRRQLHKRIEFYTWMQWIVDGQLATAQSVACAAGMKFGIMQDLAVGIHPHGADAWSLAEVFALDMSAGAPPDMFNQRGQNWSQPPLSPTALADAGYRPFRDMIRSVLRHSGAVRVDHILGLFRLWWTPIGGNPADGTYVRYDHEALVGILCLEAYRAGAVVIGEDLGVVEPWVRDYLASRGILSTSVLWFERTPDGHPLPPERWRTQCMATVTTHDLPPTAGYLAGEHVDVRERLGLLTEPPDVVRQRDRREVNAVLDLLQERGLLAEHATERMKVEALYQLVWEAPSTLIGVALADAVGERRSQNQPGTHREYPNWMVPLSDGAETPVLIEDLAHNARLQSLIDALPGARRRHL